MSFTGTALELLGTYGYLALFAFMFLETSMVFPWLPSEVVVPSAAALLIRGPASFLLFVATAAAGGVAGSVFLYLVFREAGHLVEAHGHRVKISQDDIDRGRHWFHEYGESSVLWGRFLPVLRTVISVPAGLAEMDARKFALYSGTGTAAFAAVVGSLTALGLEALPTALLGRWAGSTVTYLLAHPPVALVLVVLAVVAALAYRRSELT